jgi:hypothetical protein
VDDFHRATSFGRLDAIGEFVGGLALGEVPIAAVFLFDHAKAVVGVFLKELGALAPTHPTTDAILAFNGYLWHAKTPPVVLGSGAIILDESDFGKS